MAKEAGKETPSYDAPEFKDLLCHCGHKGAEHEVIPENEKGSGDEGDYAGRCVVRGCQCTAFAPLDQGDADFMKEMEVRE